MRTSTLQLSQISLLLLLTLNSSLVLSARPENFVSSTSLDESFSSESRFLQRSSNFNNNQATCPTGQWCAFNANVGVEYTIVLSRRTYLTAAIMLINQPETDLTITYTSTSSSANITTELTVSALGQTTTTIATPLTNSFSAVVPQATIQDYEGGAVYFAVDNPTSSSITITLKMTFASSSDSGSSSDNGVSMIYIILPIAGTLVLIFILGICCHCRRKRLEQERMANVMRGGRRVRRARGGEDQQVDGEEVEVEVEDEDPLTEQNINERFPQAKFDDLRSSFPQNTCSVCLEEFQKGVACRQLYCEHMFHSECIRLWLVNQLKKGHAFCPNCNKNMMSKQPEAPSVDIQA